ncbi:hypothetical protein ACQP2T_13600 [Nonomuraea sp. CA-143628]|uniref:hypothetical protein n=1 Tax=Nonomuraea sp. CA-143628 TaxID=3239997 RepID=UPI003D8DAF68
MYADETGSAASSDLHGWNFGRRTVRPGRAGPVPGDRRRPAAGRRRNAARDRPGEVTDLAVCDGDPFEEGTRVIWT